MIIARGDWWWLAVAPFAAALALEAASAPIIPREKQVSYLSGVRRLP